MTKPKPMANTEYFKGINKIPFEGSESDNPFSFKYYNPDQIVAGKTMRDHFKFAIAYWHSFCGQGTDPFGAGTQNFPWIRQQIQFKQLETKQMQPLSLYLKWDSTIIDFMIMIWFKRLRPWLSLKKESLRLQTTSTKTKQRQESNYFGEQPIAFLIQGI